MIWYFLAFDLYLMLHGVISITPTRIVIPITPTGKVIPITPTGMAPRSMALGCPFQTWISGTQATTKDNHIAYNTLCINYHIVAHAQQEQIRRL